VPRQPLREDPRHLWCCLRVGLQPVRPPPPRRMGLVRMRAGVGEPVPIRRPPRYRPCSRVCAAIAVRTRILVRVISRLDCKPSAIIVCS
jgi:hypothetical protein